MTDQCALNESGGLKEAEEIEFFFSESETAPMHSSSAPLKQNPGSSNSGEPFTPLPPLI